VPHGLVRGRPGRGAAAADGDARARLHRAAAWGQPGGADELLAHPGSLGRRPLCHASPGAPLVVATDPATPGASTPAGSCSPCLTAPGARVLLTTQER